MMRVLPDCAKCGEHELRLSRAGDTFWLYCYECGWKSGIVTLTTGQELDEVIAATVAASAWVKAHSVGETVDAQSAQSEGE